MDKVRNGEYTIELSPNGNQYILKKGVNEIATIATTMELAKTYSSKKSFRFMRDLLESFLAWYHCA